MGVITTIVLAGTMLASAGMSYANSKSQAKKAKFQAGLSARQGEMDVKRSAQAVKEAKLELADAQKYQEWKDEYVAPVLDKALKDPRMPDPTDATARAGLGAGAQRQAGHEAGLDAAAGAGFEAGGNRQAQLDKGISATAGGSGVAALSSAHDTARQAGIANSGQLVNMGRQVYKQQGLV